MPLHSPIYFFYLSINQINSALDLKFQLIKFKYISNLFVSAEE